jgi:mycothiol synthase
VGYARVAPLPGLPGQYDLDMLIARVWQRQGLGSRLIAFLKQALVGSDVANLSWGVSDSQSGIANFLCQNGFKPDHEELILARPHLDDLPLPPAQPQLSLHTYPLHQTIPLFCRLYDASFAGHAWFQPYTPDEVAADLISARDILFLVAEKRPFGFAWLHVDEHNEGKIEPIGILPDGQGIGNGRFLFLSALHELKQRGAQSAIIGAWANNLAAIHLYESVGFSHQQTITYYACQV